jgi:hypothetical protein
VKILQDLVSAHLPALADHLAETDMALPVVSMRWFMCLFILCFPAGSWNTTFRILDLFFAHGSVALFHVALGILKTYEEKLLDLSDSDEIMGILRNCDPDIEELFIHIAMYQELVTSGYVDQARSEYRPEFLAQMDDPSGGGRGEREMGTITEEEERQLLQQIESTGWWDDLDDENDIVTSPVSASGKDYVTTLVSISVGIPDTDKVPSEMSVPSSDCASHSSSVPLESYVDRFKRRTPPLSGRERRGSMEGGRPPNPRKITRDQSKQLIEIAGNFRYGLVQRNLVNRSQVDLRVSNEWSRAKDPKNGDGFIQRFASDASLVAESTRAGLKLEE